MNQLAELRAWYESQPPRERMALLLGSAALLVMLLYSLALRPFFSSKAKLESHVVQQQTTLAAMRPLAMQLQSLRGQQPASLPPGQSLLALIDKSAGDAGLSSALKQVQASGESTVKVQMQGVGFDNLIRWLGNLHQQYGINVTDLTAQRATGPGTVDASLTLASSTP